MPTSEWSIETPTSLEFDDVTGLRVRVSTAKSKVHTPSAEAMVLLRYPRPYAVAEVVGLPTVVTPRPRADSVEALPRVVAAPG